MVTSAPTFKTSEGFSAYAPYVREMEYWFEYADEVAIVSPARYKSVVFTTRFKRKKILFFRTAFFSFQTWNARFRFLFLLPLIIVQMIRSFLWADHLHLRCPGNIGLIACFLQIFFPKKPKTVKYAGNWDPEAVQPWSYNLQKWILGNTFLTRNMKVLVYGEWPGQTENIKPFFTASFSEAEIDTVKEKIFKPPFNFIFVGNLVPGKNPLLAVKIVEELRNSGFDVNLEIYGAGTEIQLLEVYCKKNSLEAFVSLKGNRPLQELKEAYQKAHFLILPSQSEGWPKAVAEAMFFGCIPITTTISCVPWMLGYESPPPREGGVKRGILIPFIPEVQTKNPSRTKRGSKKKFFELNLMASEPFELTEVVTTLEELMKDPEKMMKMSEAAKEWSQQYTLERFEKGIREVLGKRKKDL